MKKRLKAIKEGRITTEQEVIDLDIVEYVNASSRMMQKFFTEECKESYKYILRSFLFQPQNEVGKASVLSTAKNFKIGMLYNSLLLLLFRATCVAIKGKC